MTRIVYFLFYALSLLPFRILYGMADIGYVFLFYIIRYRRGVVHRNLVTSFPEKSPEEIGAIERKFYRWFCDYFLEAIKLLRKRTVVCGLSGSLLQLGVAVVCWHESATWK